MFATTSDLVVAPAVNPQPGYQVSDFSLIAIYGCAPMALVVRVGLSVDTADAFIEKPSDCRVRFQWGPPVVNPSKRWLRRI